ncbi:hypothetical protein [Riemerella anatipestifer]|uniref:Uncharacterized protein n=1 Tax=Riemerella anatipestifer TaxID=34085 RepID=A0AAP6HH44_RIEAN|nr:hypothetical protein [Riemerella anatipestifer]EFT36130.1 hypothetical protein RAYM_02362 [Riemerella anatipestifer RA-YM]AKP69108.1 hypothetical protein CG08_0786 [Riemerella anatipestifer]MBT0549808.1 hypothetical protein [Riemerella anatipestifer]MCD5968854.1 hypothetical protein [Riemerella anatipestifer]MCU7540898.1 hypothetical protein [Riemerella anatipestifer]
MNTAVIPFKVPVLTPAFSAEQEMFCSKKKCCKKFKKGKRCKKCPGRLKMA